MSTQPYTEDLPIWAGIQIDRADYSPAHQHAFDLVPATCSKVGDALNTLRQDVEAEYHIKPEDGVALDLSIHRAFANIKTNATEPLRKALIHACKRTEPIFEYDPTEDNYEDTQCETEVIQNPTGATVILKHDYEHLGISLEPTIHIERRRGAWYILVTDEKGESQQIVLEDP